MIMSISRLVVAGLLIFSIVGGPLPAGADDATDPSKVQLDADRVLYDESGGTATAEGNVRVSNRDLRLYAPYVEYHADRQRLVAQSTAEGAVSLLVGGKQLYGERVEYDLATRSGVLTNASGKVDAIYIKGRSIEVVPLEEARRQGWGSSKQMGGSDGAEGEVAARWQGVEMTTCSRPRPHYRLVSKQVTVIPGKRVIVKTPKIYIGEHLLFAYPFDYVIRMDERARSESPILPLVNYDGDKGAGLGLSGPIDWGSGGANLGVMLWSRIDPEIQARFHQSLTSSTEVYAVLNRLYDKDTEDLAWRPEWGLRWGDRGWTGLLRWTQRELYSVERNSGETDRYVVWRDPEFLLTGPWRRDLPTNGWWRPFLSWGSYEDATTAPGETYRRLGAGLELYVEPSSWGQVRPFFHVTGWGYGYDDEADDRQGIVDAEMGLRYSLGQVDLMSAFVRRWTSGESPMGFDAPDDREDVYQELLFTFLRPTADTSWKLGLRGAYDLLEEEFGEFVARLIYDQHCLLWELVYRDDLKGTDDWVGVRMEIKAYPQVKAEFGSETLYDPGKRPEGLPAGASAEEGESE
jgi:LPS-assembly protein